MVCTVLKQLRPGGMHFVRIEAATRATDNSSKCGVSSPFCFPIRRQKSSRGCPPGVEEVPAGECRNYGMARTDSAPVF